MSNLLAAALREPLLHFLVIGLAIFGLDRATQSPDADPRLVRVDQGVYTEIATVFAEARGRMPTEDEIAGLADLWVSNEVLFREAKAMGLDQNDQLLRERLQSRMRLLMYSGISVEPPEDAVLEAWYAERRDMFATPERLSLTILGLDGPETLAREILARLEAGETPRDVMPRGRVPIALEARPRSQLVDLFGESFVAGIEAGGTGAWQAIDSPRGWQVVRLDARLPRIVPPFEDVRTEVKGHWSQNRFQQQAQEALAALRASYPVAWSDYDPEATGAEVERARAAAEAADASGRGSGL